ncbi:beta-1,6-N-acetylglucosaminyltransferase [Pseudoroseomonas globiformis]|uniref:Peptide O-xylosyltransferase n=1 Tax=Teichococcus globiformis TaxID=2307229 RepID=A0ABV7FY25_9PROT
MLLYYVQIHQVNPWVDYLASVLRSEGSACVISYDCPGPWPNVTNLPARLMLRSSGPITWGGGSQVTALLEMFTHALSLPHRWNYLINLSGQDVPLKTPAQLADFERRALARGHDAFINYYGQMAGVAERFSIWDGVPDSDPNDFENVHLKGRVMAQFSRQARRRFFDDATDPEMRYYCRPLFLCQNNYARKQLRIDKPSIAEIEYRRAFLERHGSHGGRAWYVLSRRFVEAFVRSPFTRELQNYLNGMFCGDELFVQTWIRNEGERLKLKIVESNMRFRHGDPVTLTESLIPELTASSALFARKLDAASQPQVAEWAQARIPSPETLALSQSLLRTA